MTKTLPLALLFAALSVGAASAQTVNPLVALDEFNAIVFTNATTTSDIEGAAIIGGNFSGATVFNNPVTGTPPGYASLTVFGDTSGNSININNGGTAYVGGSKGVGINFNGGGKYLSSTPPATISEFKSAFTSFSQSLSTLAATSVVPPTNNNEIFEAKPASDGVAVFDLTASQLANIPSFSVALNGATSVIFNVSGSSISYSANDESGTTGANDIIWNFYQATSVNLGAQIGGSVLAPLANVTNQNQIDGALVANSLTANGELHDYAYLGSSPLAVAATPEPSEWLLMLVGVGVIGLTIRRHRKAARVRSPDAVAA
jgi:choice-of-anchor A domain-containing protein